jgi:hypothetical protein
VKYKDGWKIQRCWVRPGQILAKAKTQEERTRHAWLELSTVLSIAIHNTMQPSAPAGAEAKIDDTWELDVNSVQIEMKANGVPKFRLGKGSFCVVGL